MKKTRIVSATLAAVLTASTLFTGCGQTGTTSATGGSAAGSTTGSTGKVSITMLNSKSEIAQKLQQAVDTFNKTNKDGITISMTTVSSSSTVDETMMSKYASGNPCTINMVDPVNIASYASKSADLSSESWASQINDSFVDSLKVDGKIYAFPFAVEGDGLIYNKNTIEKAIGGTFDPTSIKSQADLEALYKKIQAGGVTPVEISHDDWSLASHYLALAYTGQDSSTSETQYYKDLKSGKESLANNTVYNGLVNLLDLNKKYNIYKASPMSSDYNTSDPKNIATGKVAFWFNGVWVMPNVSQFLTGDHAKDELGFLPLYAGGKTDGNIMAGGSKVILIDNTKSTPEQRKAANTFLNWLATDDAGQKALSVDMGIISAFKDSKYTPSDSLSKSMVSYIKAGKTFVGANLSGDYYTKVGAYLQQYLTGNMDKSTLTKSIDSYFQSASWVK
ncbi:MULTISPECIES: ABC transporter substrate-binding protein [Caproicibacterium]|uniref:ABC transporter substrate-binding protein n=1 Tax=Caproicibacterium argilliputei TaxID=3030016 RepID=A0AA97DBQ3_9FIRM|nr:ABC transporter substrate-binding protein [Caproicibacterium argilliputei]WOC32496.1 ABC transporter substrate-binding protein [Caproicibacterium argilliputei]